MTVSGICSKFRAAALSADAVAVIKIPGLFFATGIHRKPFPHLNKSIIFLYFME